MKKFSCRQSLPNTLNTTWYSLRSPAVGVHVLPPRQHSDSPPAAANEPRQRKTPVSNSVLPSGGALLHHAAIHMNILNIITLLRSKPLTPQSSVEDLAKSAGISRVWLYDIVVSETSCTPDNLLHRRRVEIVLEWMCAYPEVSERAPLLELAKKCYYHDPKSLVSAFESLLYEHPSACRKRLFQSDNMGAEYCETLEMLWAGLPVKIPAVGAFVLRKGLCYPVRTRKKKTPDNTDS